MEFIIQSYESVGPIRIGMTKEEVRSVIEEAPNNDHYFRGPYTDWFLETGLFVYYTAEDGVCEAVEFTEPITALLESQKISNVPYIEAKNWLAQLDSELKEESFVGVTSYKLGVGLYCPNYYDDLDPTIPVEAVIVFRKGYYDKLVQL